MIVDHVGRAAIRPDQAGCALSPFPEPDVKMLELLLLRHAKSRWNEPGIDDHDRDLAPRGKAAATRMGLLLEERRLVPDLVLCSTARRAVHTLRLAGAAMGTDPPTVHDDRLYLAAPGRMIEVVRQRGGGAARLLLVGHDPGMHHLATRLAATGDAGLRADLAAKFPTAALALIALDLAAWADLATHTGELRGFWKPRQLGIETD